MWATGIDCVAQVGAQVCMVVFGLPRLFPDLTTDRGSMDAESASDFCLPTATFEELLDFVAVSLDTVTIACVFKETQPFGVDLRQLARSVLRLRLEPGLGVNVGRRLLGLHRCSPSN